MSDELRSPDDAAIEVRILRSTDWAWAIVGGLGCLLFAAGAVMGLPKGSIVVAVLYRVFAVGAAYMSGAIGSGAAWRLIDRRPAMVATPYGIRFHPSFLRAEVLWSQVKWVGLKSGPARLGVRLKFSFWAPGAPFTASEIAIPVMTLGWSVREARARAKLMRQWRQRTLPPKPPRQAGTPRRRRQRREVM
jgi:hypothetical protein